jgi:aminoglycoside phosphotransferase (APT) family kinase protein
LISIQDIKEKLQNLFKEIYSNQNIEVVDIEEIKPGWEARIVGFRLISEENSTEMVARIYNDSEAGNTAEREAKAMQSLVKSGYPAARVYHWSSQKEPLGAPFIIMEKLPGGSLMDVYMKNPQKRKRVLNTLGKLYVDLHRHPRKSFPIKPRYRSTQGRIKYLLNRYLKYLKSQGFESLLPALSWLEAHRSLISNTPVTVIHGDFHPMNVLLRADGTPVVLDWTQVDVGDFREDLAWTKMLASTILDPALGEAIVSSYEEATGQGVVDLDYFMVLELMRRLVIFLEMIKYQGKIIESRNESGEIRLDQRQHYLKVLSELEAITRLSFSEIRSLLD